MNALDKAINEFKVKIHATTNKADATASHVKVAAIQEVDKLRDKFKSEFTKRSMLFLAIGIAIGLVIGSAVS